MTISELPNAKNSLQSSPICVLDASSYLGFWILKGLLSRGYSVHAAVQNNGRETEMMKNIKEMGELEKRLELFVVDILDYQSILGALKGCSALFCCLDSPDGYDENMVDLEVRGVINVVEACAQTQSVEKIVFSSSLAAGIWRENVCMEKDVDERSWSDAEFCRKVKLWYAMAKTLSEQAAWALAMDRMVNMVSINAALILGPGVAHQNPGSTMSYLKGAAQMCENGVLACVDVHFLTDVHIRAFEAQSASGRYFCFNQTVKTDEDAMKLAKQLSPLITVPARYECHAAVVYPDRLKNKKLNKLAQDIHKKKYSDSYGVTTDDTTSMARDPTLDLWENVANWNFSHSSSDVGEKEPKGSVAVKSTKKSASDLVLETYARSLSGRRLSIGSVESFVLPSIEMALDSNLLSSSADNLDKENDGVSESLSSINPVLDNSKDECGVGESLSSINPVLDDPINEYPTIKKETTRTYNVSKKNTGLSKIPLPGSAASFYSGTSTQMEVIEECQSIKRLTGYLNARRTDVNAGIPGRFLHAVMGQDASDVGSIASTILYAFYLDEMLNDSRLCTIPIINMKRADLNMHAELKWLLDSCQIDQSSLVFIDEIDLSYYDLFGSLKLVLLNGHKLPTKLEALKEALVEIFNCKQANSLYPWVDKVTMEQGSSCTIIAEKFALTSPEILGGQCFSRLLLAGILFDTGNLKNAQCTTKDKYMSTLLIKGASRFGCNGLYQILKYKKFDISELKVNEILRKDYKKWARLPGKPDSTGSRLTVSHIGMSSIGVPIHQLLAYEPFAAEEIILFQRSEKLRLLMIVSGYYDAQKNFKREILVSADTAEHMRNLLHFFNSNSSTLPLRVLDQPGLREELRAFEVDNKITSRKTIEKLLEEFGGATRRG